MELIMTVPAPAVSLKFWVSISLLVAVKLEKRWLLVPCISWTTLSLAVSKMTVFYAPNKVFYAPPTNKVCAN